MGTNKGRPAFTRGATYEAKYVPSSLMEGVAQMWHPRPWWISFNSRHLHTPFPYTIQWLNQGKGIQVSSRCLVSLSIGKNYKDEIWCDVTPMDACHVILGRPWLFDRNVMRDGRMNTYSSILDHKKITLTPFALPNSSSQKKPHKRTSYSLTSSRPKTISLSHSRRGSYLT